MYIQNSYFKVNVESILLFHQNITARVTPFSGACRPTQKRFDVNVVNFSSNVEWKIYKVEDFHTLCHIKVTKDKNQ